jgi:hypothetical protein
VVRVGLFFDGDHIAGALVLAQAKAESGTRWELDRGRRSEVRRQRSVISPLRSRGGQAIQL